MNKSRFKLFIENMLFYGGLSMLTKALPFITLPIITRLLPDASAYGIADMFNVVNDFGIAIAGMGIYDAVFREFFEDKDNKEYQKQVTSTGLVLVIISSVTIFVIMLIFRKGISNILFESVRYGNLILISGMVIFLGTTTTLLGSPTRMRNKRKVYFYTGVGFPLIGFCFTYFFIKLGFTFEALIYGTFIMSLVSFIVFLILNKEDFSLHMFNKKVAKELLKIGLPLLPTFLIYWVFNSMDRIMINKMIGSSELGIYSVGAKVASVSLLIYTAFSGGWGYFKFSTMKDEDQVQMNSKVFEYLGIISIMAFIIAMPFIKPVFSIFLKGDYRRGSEVFSYLFLSPLILMLFQIIGTQMMVIKKSYYISFSLIIGVVLNAILNYFLIQKYGIRGSAFATLISYIISTVIMSIICIRKNLLIVNKKFILVSFLSLIGIIESLVYHKIYSILYLFIFLLIVRFYFKDVYNLKKWKE